MNQTPETATPERRQREDGRRSRDAILDAAAELATVDGLDGLSIGSLAARTSMSKSGLYAHFKSKEELQVATIGRAGEIFDREVVAPAHDRGGTGLRLLWALSDEFIAHLRRHVFPGGCFFAAVGAEFDTHPGRVHDLIAAFSSDWVGEIAAAVAQAQAAGELDPGADPEQLVFEVNALLLMAHAGYTMFDDDMYLDRALRALVRLIGPPPA
jgi:AcrR family transcriptional regulator